MCVRINYTNITEKFVVYTRTYFNVLLLHKLWVEQLYCLHLMNMKRQIVLLIHTYSSTGTFQELT